MSTDGQGTYCRRNIAESFNRLSRAHERYRRQTDDRQTTDGQAIAYSEREREFTFANNTYNSHHKVLVNLQTSNMDALKYQNYGLCWPTQSDLLSLKE